MRFSFLIILHLSVAVLLMFVGAQCGGNKTTPLVEAIEQSNREAAGIGLQPLTEAQFYQWLDVAKDFVLPPSKREAVVSSFKSGNMPEGCSLGVNAMFKEVRIQPFNIPLITEKGFLLFEDLQALFLQPVGLDLATEPFKGELPPMTSKDLDVSVESRVTTITVTGESIVPSGTERDGLKIELRLTQANLDAAADYFGTGFGKEAMLQKMAEALGSETGLWVDLRDLIPNWVGQRVSTFPTTDDLDVCHGVAREFYYPTQDPRHNQSTEATELLLHQSYCLLSSEVHPRFGDYLYVPPGYHSGRYIMKDRASGRDISFSVQSGGCVPYRFWWVDEDFSDSPFGHKPDPSVFATRIDVWRRCR